MYKECLHCKKFFEKPYSCSVRNFTDSTQRNFRKCCSRKCQSEYRKGNPEYKVKLDLKGLEVGRKWWIGKKREYTWNKGTIGVMKSNSTSFQKGIKPWNTGKEGYHITISEEGREKKILARKGKKHSLETRRKISESQRGEKAWNWQGGKKKKLEALRKTLDYRLWREAVFERDDWTCQNCRQRGGKLNADHIKPFVAHPDLRFDINNGRTLCIPCHRQTETYGINQRYIKEKVYV